MPLVILQRPVYYDKVYRPRAGGTEIPAQFCDKLPRDAKLVEGTIEIPEVPAKPEPIALSQIIKPSKGKKDTLSALTKMDTTELSVDSDDE